jgi:putative membrane protein
LPRWPSWCEARRERFSHRRLSLDQGAAYRQRCRLDGGATLSAAAFCLSRRAEIGSDKAETFKIMERRLLRGIMVPAVIMVVLFGALLAATPGVVDWHQSWIWAKLVLVAGLIVFHHQLAYWRKSFAADAVPHNARFFRLVNELPMIALIAIVVLVVVKPF